MAIAKKIMSLVLIVGLFGCGESFRSANSLNSEFGGQPNEQANQQSETQYFDSNGTRRSFTEPNVEQNILLSYQNDLQGREAEIGLLANSIKAFDLILAADQNQQFRIQGRVVMDCRESYHFEQSVTMSQLQSTGVVVLGRDGDYELEVRCTTSSCQELVAAISKVGGSNRAMVLVGLAVGGNGEGQVLFISRNVDVPTYYATFPHVQQFEQARGCSISNQETNIMDGIQDTVVEMGFNVLKNFITGWF